MVYHIIIQLYYSTINTVSPRFPTGFKILIYMAFINMLRVLFTEDASHTRKFVQGSL